MNQITSSENKGFGPTSQHPPPPHPSPTSLSTGRQARQRRRPPAPSLRGISRISVEAGTKQKGESSLCISARSPPSVPDQHTTKGKEEEAT